MLRRPKILGASHAELVDSFVRQARSVLEYCALVWHAGVTQINISVQKTACSIILGKKYTSYQAALKYLGLDKLD